MFEIKPHIDAKIELHIHHHGEGVGSGDVLNQLVHKMDQLKECLMAVRQDIVDFSAKVDAATTAIGDRIQKLIDASTTLTAEEKVELQRLSDHLDSMGRDPNNPAPPLPPV